NLDEELERRAPGLVLGWLATAIGGAVAGRSPATGGKPKSPALELLIKIAPTVFLIGLLAGVSWLVQVWVVNINPHRDFLDEVNKVRSGGPTPEDRVGPAT